MQHTLNPALQRDLVRALRTHCYEVGEGGILLGGAGVFIGGAWRHAHCPAGGEFGAWQIDPNKVVLEGLVYMLNAAFAGGSQITTFFVAPFSGNVEPQDEWKASTFPTVATEFEGYTSSTRLPWTVPQATNAAAVGNAAAVAASTIVFSAEANLYGVALLSANAKSSTTGKLVAASLFEKARTNMAVGDKLGLEYTITAVDES